MVVRTLTSLRSHEALPTIWGGGGGGEGERGKKFSVLYCRVIWEKAGGAISCMIGQRRMK